MIVRRKDNEILVRFSAKTKVSKIQSILDYLRYEELTSTSVATKRNVEDLLKEAKKGRWDKIKKEKCLDNQPPL